MEALDYFKEARRMCKSYPDCKGCPLINSPCGSIRCLEGRSDAEMRCEIKVVEQWSKEHPLVTNEMKVREVFGDNAVNSILVLPPSDIKRWLAEPYKECK